MNAYTPLDSLKELTARADQLMPAALKALAEVTELGDSATIAGLTTLILEQLEFGGVIAAALAAHEPDPVSAGEYSDGRPVTTTTMLGRSGSPFAYVWPADPDATPDEPQVLAGDGRLFQIRVCDGQVTATPCGRGQAMPGEGMP